MSAAGAIGGNGSGSGSGSGSGGDDGEERRNGKKPEKVDEAMRMDIDGEEEEEGGEKGKEVEVKQEEGAEAAPSSAAPSEGGRDTDTREAAAFLLMLKKWVPLSSPSY